MAVTPVTLYSNPSLTVAKTEVVSALANTTRVIHKATFTNTSGSTQTIDLYIDPTGSSEVQIADTKVLIDQETWSCPDIEGHVLTPSGTIDVTPSAANVQLVISGRQITG